MSASCNGHTAVVQLLIENGADITVSNEVYLLAFVWEHVTETGVSYTLHYLMGVFGEMKGVYCSLCIANS